ncbi:MAG: peptidoglycan DD-metalloendopeptidase family protein [Anaerolineae bacterium]|nr:peptidoglycan DD-metalloendopeptidase family protein [Anaerolineae bacterium]
MRLDLYIGPRRQRRGRGILLVFAVLMLIGLIAWQQGWLPEAVTARLEQQAGPETLLPAAAPLPPESALTTPDTVRSQPVMNLPSIAPTATPQTQAYTADLYQEAAVDDEIPWPNVGGRAKIVTYTVQEGDTLWSIAAQFELDVDTLRWSNPDLERNPDVVPLGAELLILPVQGVYHRVAAGDTVEDIAARYGVSKEDITHYPPNALYAPYELESGQGVIVPYGRKELDIPKPSLSPDSPLAWPLVGPITQGFHADHLAIDLGGPYGTTVYAADDGEVIYARWAETGYGYTLIIDHGEGLETWYSHLKGTFLQSGFVARGDPIGEVGSTGRSTGPHVHFEVRVKGERVNPLDYLSDSPQ